MYTYEGKFQLNKTADIWIDRILYGYNLILYFVSGEEFWRLSTHPSRLRARSLSYCFEGISSSSNLLLITGLKKTVLLGWCYAFWKDKYARNSLRYIRQSRMMTWWRTRSKFPTVRWLSSWFKCSGWKMTVCMHHKAPDESLQWHKNDAYTVAVIWNVKLMKFSWFVFGRTKSSKYL